MGLVEKLYQKITGNLATTVKALQDGFNNTSYLINGKDVFRLKKMSDAPFYSPQNEGKILSLIAPNRLGPRLYYFDYETGNMLDRYIEGDHRFVGPTMSDDDMRKMANVVRRLHGISGCHSEFYAEQRFSTYKSKSGLSLQDPFEDEIRSIIAKCIASEPLVLCHNDLVHDNILKNEETSQITLIDFEFAGLNNAMFDLASLLSENKIFDLEKCFSFIDCYYGKDKDEIKRHKVLLYMAYENYLWYYWASARFSETNYSGFKEIADDKLAAISLTKKQYKNNPDLLRL